MTPKHDSLPVKRFGKFEPLIGQPDLNHDVQNISILSHYCPVKLGIARTGGGIS